MTLTTHAIVGAAVATIIPTHPAAGFVFGFTSHFVLDAIPHWDYSLRSLIKHESDPLEHHIPVNRAFFRDLFKIGGDAVLGLVLAVIIFAALNRSLILAAALGAIAAMLPDGLQFVYFHFRHEPLRSLQKFHMWIHAQSDLNSKPVWGVTYQLLLVIFTLALVIFYQLSKSA